MISSAPQWGSRCCKIVSVLKYNQVVGHSYGQQFHFVSGTIYMNEMISISGSKLICKCGEGWRELRGQMHGFLEMEMTLIVASDWSIKTENCCWLVAAGDMCISVGWGKQRMTQNPFICPTSPPVCLVSGVTGSNRCSRSLAAKWMLSICKILNSHNNRTRIHPQDRHLSGQDRFVTQGLFETWV